MGMRRCSLLHAAAVLVTASGAVLALACSDIDEVLVKMSTSCHTDVQLELELLCAREVVLCMEDSNSVRVCAHNTGPHSFASSDRHLRGTAGARAVQVYDVVLATLMHVLSPGELVADIKGLLLDFPSRW